MKKFKFTVINCFDLSFICLSEEVRINVWYLINTSVIMIGSLTSMTSSFPVGL